jgi:hypothetical protein
MIGNTIGPQHAICATACATDVNDLSVKIVNAERSSSVCVGVAGVKPEEHQQNGEITATTIP